MTTTLAQVCRNIVEANIDQDYIKECGYTALREVYDAEYGYNGLPTWRKCKDYLQGLPSVCTVPFENYGILSLLGDSIGVDFNNDDKCADAIDAYWNECGKAFCDIINGK